MGAALGGLAGAGFGGMFPGDDPEDEDGKKSRLMEALKYGLLGAGAGGLMGAGVGAYNQFDPAGALGDSIKNKASDWWNTAKGWIPGMGGGDAAQ
jgi:hypothetical protein